MTAPYEQLIDAAISHLQDLKARGTRFVPVASGTLAMLSQRLERSPAPTARATPPPSRSLPSPPVAPEPARTVPSTPPPSASASTPEAIAKAEAMRELRERALVRVKCPNLASARRNVVFGVGSIDADLMFVGEAPGADEDQQGEPFVGAAGQLLARIIQAAGLSRDTVYIANILKCRPDTRASKRQPQAHVRRDGNLHSVLHSQIDLIKPKVLVALGGTAVEGLLGPVGGMTGLRGHWQTYRGIPLMPTFHPAYLLRNQAPAEKRKVWEDMLQVMEKLGLPISEKQRGFFLPK